MSTVPDEAPQQWKGPLLDTAQAAERSRIAKQTLACARLKGTGCPYIKHGSRVYYYQDELDAWIASHRRRSTSDRFKA